MSKATKILKLIRIIIVALLAIAAITLAAVYVNNNKALARLYEEYQSIPITVTVRPLESEDGKTSAIPGWTIDLFTGKNSVEIQDTSSENHEATQISLSEYLKDVQIKMSESILLINNEDAKDLTASVTPDLIGITSLPSDEQLLPENGSKVTWFEGYNESFFGGEELVCIVPEGKLEAYDNGSSEARLYFINIVAKFENGTLVREIAKYECTLKIVGTYTAGDEVSFYCPLSIIEQVYENLGVDFLPDSISATLADNLLLDEFRQKASVLYSNLSEDPSQSYDELTIVNRSQSSTLFTGYADLDITGTTELDFAAAREEREEKESFNRTAVLLIKIFAIVAFLMIVIPNLYILVCRMRGIRVIKLTLNQIRRAPVPAVAILLFAAIISVIICALQVSNEAELRNYEETWKSVPITVTVTNPLKTKNSFFDVNKWVYDLFTEENPVKFYDVSAAKDYNEASEIKPSVPSAEFSLAEYVKDIQVKKQQLIDTINGQTFRNPLLYGITSLASDKQLLPEYGCVITWNEGYDESIFAGEEMVCLIPEGSAELYDNGNGESVLYFSAKSNTPVIVRDENGEPVRDKNGNVIIDYPMKEYTCTLKIAGTYTAGDELSVYCPLSVLEQVYIEMDAYEIILTLSATLADNTRLEEFREKASYCFVEPASSDEKLHWGFYVNNTYNEFYEHALDINDDALFDLAAILEDSIKFNKTVTVFVVILSVVSGFLVGFLMIRRRKRDIMLMRTVGESNARLYFRFIIEQMICIILGVIVGGAYNRWEPMDKLLIFAIVYFVGLTLALVIFLRSKLLTTVKEDE